MCGRYHLKSDSAEIRELQIKPFISSWTQGTTFAVILLEQKHGLFIWQCHFRRSSFSTKTKLIKFITLAQTVTDIIQMYAKGPNSNCLAEISNQDLKTK